jgi:hypothetical protein
MINTNVVRSVGFVKCFAPQSPCLPYPLDSGAPQFARCVPQTDYQQTMTDLPTGPVSPQARQGTVDRLCAHFAADHLETAEFERRLDRAYTALTSAELIALEQDLPELSPDRETSPPVPAPLPATSVDTTRSARDRDFMFANPGRHGAERGLDAVPSPHRPHDPGRIEARFPSGTRGKAARRIILRYRGLILTVSTTRNQSPGSRGPLGRTYAEELWIEGLRVPVGRRPDMTICSIHAVFRESSVVSRLG